MLFSCEGPIIITLILSEFQHKKLLVIQILMSRGHALSLVTGCQLGFLEKVELCLGIVRIVVEINTMLPYSRTRR